MSASTSPTNREERKSRASRASKQASAVMAGGNPMAQMLKAGLKSANAENLLLPNDDEVEQNEGWEHDPLKLDIKFLQVSDNWKTYLKKDKTVVIKLYGIYKQSVVGDSPR
jgi:hypothetical protein